MPRSLLDEADLSAVRAAAAERPGAAGIVVACLLEGGALAHAADDPDWPDRDRVVASTSMAAALSDAGGPVPVAAIDGGRGLAVAAGLAAASAFDGGVSRTFWLAEGDATDDGAVWEAALAAGPGLIAVLLVDAAGAARAQRLLGAAGWRCATGSADDPVEVLGALDRVHGVDGWPSPGVVLVAGP